MWVSRGGLPIGLTIGGYHHGTTEKAGIVIGLDVGKASHWACVATRDGEVLASKPVANMHLAPAPQSVTQPHAARVTQPSPKSASRSNQKKGVYRRQPTELRPITAVNPYSWTDNVLHLL